MKPFWTIVRIVSLFAAVVLGALLFTESVTLDALTGGFEAVFLVIGLGKFILVALAFVASVIEVAIFAVAFVFGVAIKFARFVPVMGFLVLAYFIASSIYSAIGEPWGTFVAGGGFLAVAITPTVLWNKFVPLANVLGLDPVRKTVRQTHTAANDTPMVGVEFIATRDEFLALRALCNVAGLWFSSPTWVPFGPMKWIYSTAIVEKRPSKTD